MKAWWAMLGILCLAACGSGQNGDLGGHGSGGASNGGAAGSDAGGAGGTGGSSNGGAAGSDAGGAGGTGGSSTGGSSTGGSSTGGITASDPSKPGPYANNHADVTIDVPATQHSMPSRCYFPTSGPDKPPYPVVIIAHGFQLPASQYYGYADRLASFGFVACAVDYPTSLTQVNNVANAKDLSGALDWAIAASKASGSPLSGLVDGARAGVAGHSLGGKLAVLAASMDARFKAVLGLDPVDSSMFCNPTDCPDASNKLPLPIPTAFLGELTDSTAGAGGQACAPKADNYQTFFASAAAPSIEVTLNGANHMSFLDDPSSCGLTCSFCKQATAPHAQVIGIAYSYTVAFFERYLRANAAYDAYLTGPIAQQRYVKTGQIQLQTK